MDIELLKTFLEVNKTRHFGKAADNLYLTPAAVSARVRQLEQTLGVELFIRTRNNIQLTLQGERLLPHAETMLLSWSMALQDVALKAEQHQQINLGAGSSLWNFGLEAEFVKLLGLAPQIAFRVLSEPPDILARMLVEQTVDLAFFLDSPALPDMQVEKVGQVKLVLVSSEEAATTKSALQNRYIYLDWGLSFDMFHAKRFGDLPKPMLHTNVASMAWHCLRETRGAAYLPQTQLAGFAGLTQVTGAPVYSRPLYALFRPSNSRKSVIMDLLGGLSPLNI